MKDEGEINSYIIVKNRSEYASSNRFYREESVNVRVRREGIGTPSFQAVKFAIILVTYQQNI